MLFFGHRSSVRGIFETSFFEHSLTFCSQKCGQENHQSLEEVKAQNVTMGQEQSYAAHANGQHTRPRYKDKYEDPVHYRSTSEYCNPSDYRKPSVDYHEPNDYKRHRVRRSAESFKSDNSSTESSGYRSGSNSAYDYRSASERSSSGSDYYKSSLYKNDNYKEINKELYKPVKISKEKRYKLQFLDAEDNKSIGKGTRLSSYLSETEKAKLRAGPAATKKAGIRNYTPKILSEVDQRKKIDNWI